MHVEGAGLRLGQDRDGLAELHGAAREHLREGVDPLPFDALGEHREGYSGFRWQENAAIASTAGRRGSRATADRRRASSSSRSSAARALRRKGRGAWDAERLSLIFRSLSASPRLAPASPSRAPPLLPASGSLRNVRRFWAPEAFRTSCGSQVRPIAPGLKAGFRTAFRTDAPAASRAPTLAPEGRSP